MKALNRGYYVTAALVTVAFFFATRTLLNPAERARTRGGTSSSAA